MAKILVVDDDADILNLIDYQLRKAGHRVAKASSGAEALELLDEKGQPDLVVLDVSMPNMTGFELLEKIRDRFGKVPAIFLSAMVTDDKIEAGRALDAEYLTKPFVGNALLTAVEGALPKRDGGEW